MDLRKEHHKDVSKALSTAVYSKGRCASRGLCYQGKINAAKIRSGPMSPKSRELYKNG